MDLLTFFSLPPSILAKRPRMTFFVVEMAIFTLLFERCAVGVVSLSFLHKVEFLLTGLLATLFHINHVLRRTMYIPTGLTNWPPR
jgi:hypothetical protein